MQVIYEGRLEGEFTGFEIDRIFRLLTGKEWRQISGENRYCYAFMPEVKIKSDGSKYYLTVKEYTVEVVPN